MTFIILILKNKQSRNVGDIKTSADEQDKTI